MRLLAIPTFALLVMSSGQALSATCSELFAEMNANSVKVRHSYEAVKTAADNLNEAIAARKDIPWNAAWAKEQVNIAILTTNHGIRILDRISAAGGCGRSKEEISNLRGKGVRSLSEYEDFLTYLKSIPAPEMPKIEPAQPLASANEEN